MRDGWLTSTKWSPNDFMFHGWKKHYFGSPGWYGGTPSPFLPNISFPLDSCKFSREGFDNWRKNYNTSFLAGNEKVFAILDEKAAIVRKNYTDFIKTIKEI